MFIIRTHDVTAHARPDYTRNQNRISVPHPAGCLYALVGTEPKWKNLCEPFHKTNQFIFNVGYTRVCNINHA